MVYKGRARRSLVPFGYGDGGGGPTEEMLARAHHRTRSPGETLRSARQALNLVGLDAGTASAILWTYRADASVQELAAAGLTEVTCLVHQSAIPG